MIIQTIAEGVAHKLPDDLKKALTKDTSAFERWQDLTPLARNEWICWTVTVKQAATRQNHIVRTVTELKQGKRRPCCWMGCVHRSDKPISKTQKWVLSRQSKKS